MIDTFNQVYEALLNEVNSGVSDLPIIKQYKEIAIKNWKELLSYIPNDDSSLEEFLLHNVDIKNKLYDGIIEQLIGPDGLTWNINYKIFFINSPHNLVYCGAGFGHASYNQEFRDKINKKEIYDKKSFDEYLLSVKRRLNDNNGIVFVLKINTRSKCSSLFRRIKELDAFAAHESSHMYDFMILKDKLPSTIDKYNASNDNGKLEDYYIDIELDAFTASVIEELREIKDKINKGEIVEVPTFKDALRMCKTWRSGFGEYVTQSKRDKKKNKVLIKLNHFWTTK